jgi:hypothetical protein
MGSAGTVLVVEAARSFSFGASVVISSMSRP